MNISARDGGSGMAEQGGNGCIRITEIGRHTGEGMSERVSGDAFQICLFHKLAQSLSHPSICARSAVFAWEDIRAVCLL